MKNRCTKSSQFVLGILVMTVVMVLAVGAADAQMVIVEDNEVRIETGAGGQTARLYYGGDLFLGGSGWTGEISTYTGSDVRVGYWVASTLTLGATGDDGDIVLKDSINNATTISMDGSFGQITLGGAGSTEDGDLTVLDNDGTSSIILDGSSGNVTNQIGGNGLIKAWARINSDGTVASCFRCNQSTAETRKLSTGSYEVDFTIATDITSRPLGAIVDHHGYSVSFGTAQVGYRSGDTSSVWVITRYPDDAYYDRPFTVVVY